MCLARNCKCLQTPLSVSGTKLPRGENHQVTALGAPAVLEPVLLSPNFPLVFAPEVVTNSKCGEAELGGVGAGAEW